ncbi:MAG: amidohydrolase [Alphaproteobacteria bacterium]|nr:amidohydrolase [Alphaproteobacteria bacterium]
MSAVVERLIAERLPDWIALRRDIHKHPELGFLEFRTASRAAATLERLGYAVQVGHEVMDPAAMVGVPAPQAQEDALAEALALGAEKRWTDRMVGGMTGVVGTLKRGKGPTVALRFDIDALPLREASERQHGPARSGYASTRPGVMHACGHDGHVAIGLAVAEVAASPDLRWAGTLKLIFQPAEEGGRGAKPMVEAGVVDDADWFFAAHLGCSLPSGKVAAAAEKMLFSTKWDVAFTGRAAHAAGNPHEGRNALLAGAQAALGLHGIARHGHATTHVNVGVMTAGSGRNVIAERASLLIEVRGDSDDSLDYMEGRAREVIEGAAKAQGCAHEIRPVGKTIGETSTARASAAVSEVAGAVPGIGEVLPAWEIGGGDDAAYFMRRMRERGKEACYFVVGSDLAACHHAVLFDFQEKDIETGTRLYAGLIERVAR